MSIHKTHQFPLITISFLSSLSFLQIFRWIFLMNFNFLEDLFLTYNHLTIASFRIGVPSILFTLIFFLSWLQLLQKTFFINSWDKKNSSGINWPLQDLQVWTNFDGNLSQSNFHYRSLRSKLNIIWFSCNHVNDRKWIAKKRRKSNL